MGCWIREMCREISNFCLEMTNDEEKLSDFWLKWTLVGV